MFKEYLEPKTQPGKETEEIGGDSVPENLQGQEERFEKAFEEDLILLENLLNTPLETSGEKSSELLKRRATLRAEAFELEFELEDVESRLYKESKGFWQRLKRRREQDDLYSRERGLRSRIKKTEQDISKIWEAVDRLKREDEKAKQERFGAVNKKLEKILEGIYRDFESSCEELSGDRKLKNELNQVLIKEKFLPEARKLLAERIITEEDLRGYLRILDLDLKEGAVNWASDPDLNEEIRERRNGRREEREKLPQKLVDLGESVFSVVSPQPVIPDGAYDNLFRVFFLEKSRQKIEKMLAVVNGSGFEADAKSRIEKALISLEKKGNLPYLELATGTQLLKGLSNGNFPVLDLKSTGNSQSLFGKAEVLRLEAVRKNPEVQKFFSEGFIEKCLNTVERQIVFGDLINAKSNSEYSLKVGEEVLQFKNPEVVPFVIMNCFREDIFYNYTPGRWGMKTWGPYRYASDLPEETLQKLEEKKIPGLSELIKNLKESSFWFEQNMEKEGFEGKLPADRQTAVENALVRLSNHFLEKGSEEEKVFVLELLENRNLKANPNLKVSYENIANIFRKFPDSESRPVGIILDFLAGRALFDKAALVTLKNFLLEPANEEMILKPFVRISWIVSSFRRMAEKTTFPDCENIIVETLEGLVAKVRDGVNGKALDSKISEEILENVLWNFNKLKVDSPVLREFIKSESFKNLLTDGLKNKPGEFTRELLERSRLFNDGEAIEVLFDGMKQFESGSVSESRKAITSFFRKEFEDSILNGSEEESQFFGEMLTDGLTAKIDSEDLAFSCQLAQILSSILISFRGPTRYLEKFADYHKNGHFIKDSLDKLEAALAKFAKDEDIIKRFYALKPSLYRHELASADAAGLIARSREIEQYESGAGKELVDFARKTIKDFSKEDVGLIVKSLADNKTNEDLVLLFALNNSLSPEAEIEAAKVIGRYDLSQTPLKEILPEMWEGRAEARLTSENWVRLLLAFLRIQDGPPSDMPGELAENIKEIFSAVGNKNLCLKNFRDLYLKFLDEGGISMPLNASILASAIFKNEGAGPLKHVEALGNMIFLINELLLREETAPRTKKEIAELLKIQENRFGKEHWNDDDKSNFYSISADVLKAAPSLYAEFLRLFGTLSPKEMKKFAEQYYPLYQAELVMLQSESGKKASYNPRDLAALRDELRKSSVSLRDALGPEREMVLAGEKNEILAMIQKAFKKRFGLIKIPEEMGGEKVRTLANLSRYLGNIADRDEGKEALLSLFLGLNLHDQWSNFRMNRAVSLNQYFEGKKLDFLEDYLKKREKETANLYKVLGISGKKLEDFQKTLQEETVSRLIGNVETIDVKLGNIIRNLADLSDADIYPDPVDKAVLSLVKNHGRAIGGTLAKIFRVANGQPIVFDESEEAVKKEIEKIYGVDKWTGEKIKNIQDRVKIPSLVANLLTSIETGGVEGAIEELRQKLEPPRPVIEIFNRLGEEFEEGSGAMALSQDLLYLENILVKNENKLNAKEKETLSAYIGGVRGQMAKLERSFEDIKNYFSKIKQGIHTTTSPVLKNRIEQIDEAINSKASSLEIVTRTTNDLNLIVENMRQCLGCLRKEANNDTNLTFGDSNKFFVMSQSGSEKGSIADQIVFLEPTTYEGKEPELAFIMDRIYGNKSSDLLLSHALSVFKKYSELRKKFPENRMSILVSDAAMGSVGLTGDTLANRLREQIGGKASMEIVDNADVEVVESAAGDHYVEFGGASRKAGKRKVSGLVLR